MGWICAFCETENDNSEKECIVCGKLKSETDAKKAADLAFKRKKEEEEKLKEEARKKEEAKRLAEENRSAAERTISITSMSFLGGTYVGMVVRGVPHGKGKFYKKSGEPSTLFTYDGDWVNGNIEGKGTITWVDGTKYEGEWKAGKREGYGIYYFKNGDRYEGFFKNGVFHGDGTFYYAYSDAQNRKKLEGHWIEDKLEGKAILWWWDNSKEIYTYKNDVPIHGIYYWESEDHMEGNYYDGRRDGVWKYYKNGVLFANRIYKNGKQVNVEYAVNGSFSSSSHNSSSSSSSSSTSSGCGTIIGIFILIIIVVGGIRSCRSCSIAHHDKHTKVEQKTTTTYICTASSLNVRSYASTNAPVIGKIKKGERIQVYEIKNGFAKIKYNNRTGYVSERYITLYSY